MLKALMEKEFSGYRECVKLRFTPRDWQTGVIIPIFKKGDRKQCTNYRGISSVCQGKYMPNALKGNAEK